MGKSYLPIFLFVLKCLKIGEDYEEFIKVSEKL